MTKTTKLEQREDNRWAVVDIATGKTLANRWALYHALAAQRKIERERGQL